MEYFDDDTGMIDLSACLTPNPFYQDTFTVLGTTLIPYKAGCYNCGKEFPTVERLRAHVCKKAFRPQRNGNAQPSTSQAGPSMTNGLFNNNPGASFMFPWSNPSARPHTMTRPKLPQYGNQSQPTDLTTRVDEETSAFSTKRGRREVQGLPSFYACGETSETVEAYTSHSFDHFIVEFTGLCCNICRILFKSDEECALHYQDNHVIHLYRCIVCGDVLDSLIALQMHFERTHKAYSKQASCKLCPNLVFQDTLAVQFHISMVHFKQCFRNQNTNEQEQPYSAESNLYQQTSQVMPTPSLTPQPLAQQQSLSSSVLFPKLEPQDRSYPRTPPKSFTCDICNLSDIPSEAELLSHKKLQHSKSKSRSVSLQCAYCKETFKTRSELENHMKSHQVVYGKGKHKCNICDAIFPSSVTLADHKLTHCKIIEGSICGQCKGALKNEQSFYEHQQMHSNSPSKSDSQIGFPANCVICCQTLQNTVELNKHASFHLKHLLKKHICTRCNTTFDAPAVQNGNQKQDFFNHLLSICSKCASEDDPRFIGTKEDSKDPSMFNLEQPQSASANEKNNLECRSCKQVFPSPGKLQTHLIEHNFVGMNQYSCYICSSVFTAADGLKNHILGHGILNKPYECATCDMKFFFRTELDNHIFVHDSAPNKSTANNVVSSDRNPLNDTNELNKYETCVYCRNVFSKNSYFLEHLNNCQVKKEMDASDMAEEDNKIKQEAIEIDFGNTQ